jgi:predicted RND superfamily exporter protein
MSNSTPGVLGRLAASVIASPKRSWLVIAVVSVFAAVLSTGIRVDPNMLRLLPPDHPSTRAMQDLQNTEGGVEILTIAADGAQKEDVDAFLKELVGKLEALDTVQYALYDIDPDLAWRIGMMQLGPGELAKIRDRLQGALNFGPAMLNPFIAAQWMDLGPLTAKLKPEGQPTSLASSDGTSRVIVRPTETAKEVPFSKKLMGQVYGILEEMAPESRGVKVQWVGGAYRHTVEDVESIATDLRWTAIVSLVLVFSLIGFAFRDLRAVVMIFGPLFISNVWTLGYAAMVVGTLNTFTSFFMAVLIGLGVDFSIHLYSRYREVRDDGLDVHDAIVTAWDKTGPPCVAAALTSSAGFCALWMADFIAFQELGTLLAGGVLFCLVGVLTVLPLFIVWREQAGPVMMDADRQESEDSFLGIRGRRAYPNYRLAPTILLLVGIVSVAAASTLRKVEFEYDLSELRAQGMSWDDLSDRERILAEDSYPPAVIMYDDATSLAADHVRLSDAVAAGQLTELSRVLSIYSVLPVDQTDRLSVISELGTLAKHENFSYLPPPVRQNLKRLRETDVKALEVGDLPFGLQHVLGAMDDRHWMMVFPSGNMWDLRETQKVYDAIEKWVPDQPAAGQYLALSVLYQLVRDDAFRIVVCALIAVFIITGFHMRSPRRALGATAALVAGLCWAGAGLALFRVKVSMINFVGIPILMGIGIDVVIHLLHRMSEEGPGKVLRALSTTGRAAALSAATTILSFASLSAASNHGVRSLGLMIVLGLSLVTVAAFTAVPLGWMTTWKVRGQLPRPPREE